MTNVSLSHSRASTYISDPVHDQFEITLFERNFIDSLYFQRLHFVLQNSVNYASFPSNKNTRFPHSLGVSHIAGQMFSSATSNADVADLREFLNVASQFIERIVEEFTDIFSNSKTVIEELNGAHFDTISGKAGFLHNPLEPDDQGDRVDTEDTEDGNRPFSAAFIIDTLWQAVRLYALMHDLGHLPMSHAFERGLETTQDVMEAADASESSVKSYKSALSNLKQTFTGFDIGGDRDRFFEIFQNVLSVEGWDISASTIKDEISQADIHEVRGLHIFNRYIRTANDIAPPARNPKDNATNRAIDKYAQLIHIITVFIISSKSIVGKKNNLIHPFSLLYSIKRLIDGEIDADRLDYTLRDVHEAGTHPVTFDLKSIINYCVLCRDPNLDVFVFAFHPHAVPAIEQFYEARYQSYKYIVNHRVSARSNRCMEAAIAHIFAIAWMEPEDFVADTLVSYGYLQNAEPDADSQFTILPDSGNGDLPKNGRKQTHNVFDLELSGNNGHRIDDFTFRAMCLALLVGIRRRYGLGLTKQTASSRMAAMHLQLASLLEVILYRANDNTITLFRDITLRGFVEHIESSHAGQDIGQRAREILDATSNTLAIDNLIQKSFNDISRELSATYGKDFGIYIAYTHSKVFKDDFEYLEDSIQLRMPTSDLESTRRASLESITKRSSSLLTMAGRDTNDTQVRIYAVSKNLKHNSTACEEVERLVRQSLEATLLS